MNIFGFLFNTNSGDSMNLRDVMSKKVVCCRDCDDIIFVSKVMKENDIGFVPIVSDKRVVGVITDRDIVVRGVSNGDFGGNVSNYMTRGVFSVPVNGTIRDVVDVLSSNKVKRVIVEDKKKIVGVVSISDLFNCFFDQELFSAIKCIWSIGPNVCKFDTDIDDFYL